jgi:hypothetical protein
MPADPSPAGTLCDERVLGTRSAGGHRRVLVLPPDAVATTWSADVPRSLTGDPGWSCPRRTGRRECDPIMLPAWMVWLGCWEAAAAAGTGAARVLSRGVLAGTGEHAAPARRWHTSRTVRRWGGLPPRRWRAWPVISLPPATGEYSLSCRISARAGSSRERKLVFVTLTELSESVLDARVNVLNDCSSVRRRWHTGSPRSCRRKSGLSHDGPPAHAWFVDAERAHPPRQEKGRGMTFGARRGAHLVISGRGASTRHGPATGLTVMVVEWPGGASRQGRDGRADVATFTPPTPRSCVAQPGDGGDGGRP